MSSLYRLCQDKGPLVLVIKDESDYIFGAFASESFGIKSGYYGDGSCFLWKLEESQSENNVQKNENEESDEEEQYKVHAYPATGENNYLIYTENSCIAFGGG